MGCAAGVIRYLVFLINALSSVVGLVVAVVSSLALEDINDEGKPILIMFILIGVIVFVISFFGCFGAIKENVCMTWTYAITVLAAAIISIILLCILAGHTDDQTLAKNELDDAWARQKNLTDAMSIFQTKLHCCGINGTRDYTEANLTVPTSCFYPNSDKKVYEVGCLAKLSEFYENLLTGCKTSGWIFLAIEIAAFACAVFLAITFRNEQRRRN
ncbi:protein late bloomer [Drosophila madeirensis]|uniref:Tetraspanin n=1 Tax=Drosophila madeirensis TaxID=30013 RepID=A0AAU9GB76_DROMD